MATTTISGTTNLEDTFLQSTVPDGNYGGSTSRTLAGSHKHLDRVKASAIPAGTITAGRYFLYVTSVATSGTHKVHAIKDANSWVEGTATGSAQAGSCCYNYLIYNASTPTNWAGSTGMSTAGTDYDTVEEYESGTISAAGWIQNTIGTTLLTAWRDATRTANGVVVLRSSASIGYTFALTEAVSNQPYWEVDTSVGGGVPVFMRSYRNRRV